MTPGWLPSNTEIAAMMVTRGTWVCWAYYDLKHGTKLCVWNRDIDRDPLRSHDNLLPVGYVAINYDKLQ